MTAGDPLSGPADADLDEREAALELAEALDIDPLAVLHSERFRKVSTRYPRQVAAAYSGDLGLAAAASDAEVAARVAAWEREQGLEPLNWRAIGAQERDEA